MSNGWFSQFGHGDGLSYWYLNRPTPQDHPELLVWKSHVGKPGVREKGESFSTSSAAVSFSSCIYMTGFTHRAIDILAEDKMSETCPNLCFRGYLIKLVHIHIS